MKTPDDLASLLGGVAPSTSVRGVCRQRREAGRPQVVQAIWVQGELLRVEEPPGTIDTIVGEHVVWHRDPSTGQLTARDREADVANPFTSPRILERRPVAFWRELIGSDPGVIMSGVAERVLHDRPALSVTLPGKAGSLGLTVDAQTGVWLEALLDGTLWLDWEWVVFGEAIDLSLFSLDPPMSSGL
ncbi:hypothetical protein [Nocardioides pyridinolyticus]